MKDVKKEPEKKESPVKQSLQDENMDGGSQKHQPAYI
jgi:hypothetical protein